MLFFFFQAEDGIRDLTVTGVQTCALPLALYSGSRLLSHLRLLLCQRRIAVGPEFRPEIPAPDSLWRLVRRRRVELVTRQRRRGPRPRHPPQPADPGRDRERAVEGKRGG